MTDSFKMIEINLIASIFLIVSTLFYKFIYPKKKINFLILLILVSVLPILSILRPGAYESGDFNIHLYREIDFYKSLIEGNIMPTWAGGLNGTYGYPLFIFNYSLPYYFFSFFHYFGFTYIDSIKIVLILSFIFSGIFMFYLSKKIFKNDLISFIVSVFYLFTPYHLIDLHFKVTIGELFIFTFLPLVFLLEHKLYYKKSLNLIVLSSISIAFLIMSHAILAFFSILFLFSYILFLAFKEKKYKPMLLNLSSIVLGSLASIYIWLSPILLSKYSYIQIVPLKWGYFPSIFNLLYSPWKFGLLFQGPNGEISYLFGYTQILILLLGIYYILKKVKDKNKTNLFFWVFSFIFTLFLITPYSMFIWDKIPYMKSAGSHRLTLLLTFCISIIAGYVSIYFKNKKVLIFLIVFVTIGYTILNWGHRRLIPQINDAVLILGQPISTVNGEGHYYANSRWIDVNKPWFSKIPKYHLEILKGEAKITEIFRSSTKHSYIVDAKTNITLKENTLYFPGWSAISNNKSINLTPNKMGIINLSLKKGNQNLILEYRDVKEVLILKFISEVIILIFLFYLILNFLGKYLFHFPKL